MDCLLLFREIFEGRGKQSFFFEVYLYVLFLSLVRKKKVPKRKDSVCTSGATPDAFRPKGQELASLKQPALLNGRKSSSALRPSSEAGEPSGVFALTKTVHALIAQPRLSEEALSAALAFCVKKGRLSERSEFLPFSKKQGRSSL